MSYKKDDISPQVRKKRRLMYSLEVVEQPRPSGTSFVKYSEFPLSASYIVGEKSTVQKPTHPSLLLLDYHGPVQVVWYLVADDVIHPHPYVLEGENCQDGVCTKTSLAAGHILSFPGLFVRSVREEDIKKTLERRVDILKHYLPGRVFKLKDPGEYNLSSVKICFHMLVPDGNGCTETLSLVTKSLHSKEPSFLRGPRILALSQCKGSVRGREEVTLRVANLKSDDFLVFFHCERTVPRSSWQAFADVISISRQIATPVDIVVKTPSYPDQQISEPQTVAVQIRLMDNSVSNTMKYTYIPNPKGSTRTEQKVKLKEPIYARHFACLGFSTDTNPVLSMTSEEKAPHRSQTSALSQNDGDRELRAVKKAKPLKLNAGFQPEGLWRSCGLGEGYDSKEDLGVDYDRLERYRSLMIGSESPLYTLPNGTETLPQRGGGSARVDFRLRDRQFASCSSQSMKSNQSNSIHDSSPYSSSNLTENLGRDLSLVTIQSRSSHAAASSTASWIFGRHRCVFLIKGTREVKEIVLRSPEASNLPDLAGSNLCPAVVDAAEFPVGANKAGLVAAKEIDASQFQEEDYSLWCSLEHKNLISIFGIVKQDDRHCLILDLPEEGCLEGYLSKTHPASQSSAHLWKWIVQAAQAIGYLHENGVAHQEITMANCLISAEGNLVLNFPTKSKPFLGKASAVADGEFESNKAGDVFSFAALAQNLLKSCGLPENVAKSLGSLWDACTHECESHRPCAQELVRKLQSYNQLVMPEDSAVPLLMVRIATDVAGLGSYYVDPIPTSPDSGIIASSGSKNPNLSLQIGPERTDSETSRESAFSDSTQKNENSLNTWHGESVILKPMQAELPRLPDSPEGDKPSGNESPPAETQESASTSDDHAEMSEDGSEVGIGSGADGRGGGHKQNGREEEGFQSHLCPPRVTKRVDHTGGTLELFNGEISLVIPPGALREGQTEEILLSVDWDDSHVPPLAHSDMSVAPVVQCGPTGLHFQEPVQLRLPHCGVIPDTKRCQPTVHCSQTEEGESPHWQRIATPEDSAMAVDCQDRFFILSVRHFSLYTISLNNQDSRAKKVMIVAYGPKLYSFEDDQQIRIYLYDHLVSIRDSINQEEQNLGGTQLDGPVTYQLVELHRGKMIIEVIFHTPSWLLTSSSAQVEFLFSKMWNSQPWNRCKFTFRNSTNEATQFRCNIQFQQTDNEDIAQLEISNHVKISPDSSCSPTCNATARVSSNSSSPATDSTTLHASSNPTYQPGGGGANGYSMRAPASPTSRPRLSFRQSQMSFRDVSITASLDSGLLPENGSFHTQATSSLFRQTYLDSPSNSSIMPGGYDSHSVPEVIPYTVRDLVCEKLDLIDYAVGNDWRKFADNLGFGQRIPVWKNRASHSSPTDLCLQAAQQERKIKSLGDLKAVLRRVQRLDVVEAIEEYELRVCPGSTPSSQPASEEPMALGDTPSPDDTACPLQGQRFLPASPQPLQAPDIAPRAPLRPDSAPGNSDPNMAQPAGTGMTGHILSHALPQQHGSDQETPRSTEAGLNACPHPPPPSAAPDSSLCPEGCMTPWTGHGAPGTVDENRNMEEIEGGVRRMLWKS